MPAALSPPQIDGFDDVESFAAEHGLTDALFVAFEILHDLFPLGHRIKVEHYTDPEDGQESLFFAVTGEALPVEQEIERHQQWNHRICRSLGPDELYRIGMYRDYTE